MNPETGWQPNRRGEMEINTERKGCSKSIYVYIKP